ncbi:unnamed protein product, partial [Rotaria sp. Silwood1]
KQGETAVFETKIDGYPTPKVTWLLNGKPLTPKEGAQVEMNAATGEAKLSIPKVDLQQHAGTVTCRLENPHGIQEETARLDILAAPLITTQLPKQEETVSGKDVTLRVIVRGSPRPEAQWFFNDIPITPENVTFDEEKSEYQLLVKQPTVATSEGTYRVVLKNALGETESTPCVLTVLEPVKLTKSAPTSDVVDLKVGEPFEISFDVGGKEAPKVQLTKDGKEVKFTSVEGTRHVYSIAEVKPEHQGVYKLTAKNKTSSEETTVTLNVTAPTSDVVDLKVGAPFEILADVVGKEAPKVQLTKDGKEVKFTSVEGTRHIYSVAEVKPEHQGVYKVTAKNKTSSEETSVTLNITAPLSVSQPLTDINVLLGQPGTFNLTCDAFPAPKVSWFFNDTEVKNSPKHKIEAKQNVFSLTVNKCDHPDVGTYRAHIDNGIDKTEHAAKLNVGVKPKVEAAKPANDQTCVIGQDTQISWKFSGIEKPQVTWLFNGQPLPANERFEITETEDGTSTLSIRHAELNDKGIYAAKATNAVGEAEAKTTLNIAGIKPLITNDLDAALQATKGESMTIKLSATGTPKPDIVWTRGNDELVPSDRIQSAPTSDVVDLKVGEPFEISFDVGGKEAPKVQLTKDGKEIEAKQNVFSLTVNKCDHPDVGTYRVLIDNGIDHSEQTAKLHVGVKPKVEAAKPANDQTCVIGQDTQISWKFSGLEKPQVTWLFNGQPLPTNERFEITETEDGTSTLSIRHAELNDKGTYTAKATNAVGEVEAKTTLNIAGVKPVLTTDLEATTHATKGESMTIKLSATGTPKPEVVWMRGNDELVPSDRIQIIAPTAEEDDTYTLTILNVQPEDQGDYSAKITNVGGSLKSKKCKVAVTKSPVFVAKPTTQEVKQGETAVFETKIDGYPTPKVTWLLNGKPLTPKEGAQVEMN